MGATLTEAPLTVAQARRALANTRRLSPRSRTVRADRCAVSRRAPHRPLRGLWLRSLV